MLYISLAQADKIFRENNKAVVVVIAFDDKGKPISQGSGFIVREDGAIVTNYHVISNAVDIKVKAGEKILEIEGFLHTDKENDLVILKVKGERLQTVKIGNIEKVDIGEKVYVISSPEGLENTISDGIRVRKDSDALFGRCKNHLSGRLCDCLFNFYQIANASSSILARFM